MNIILGFSLHLVFSGVSFIFCQGFLLDLVFSGVSFILGECFMLYFVFSCIHLNCVNVS